MNCISFFFPGILSAVSSVLMFFNASVMLTLSELKCVYGQDCPPCFFKVAVIQM